MRKRFYWLSCIFSLLAITSAGLKDLRSENVFLKDGSIVNATIVRDSAKSITVRDKGGKQETIPRENIMRILYTELNMGKIHVQMRNGKNFEAYMVDEDQKTYTFRKVLNDPQELTINRTEVLFIAERNPSGLKGTAGTNKIELSWYPPYNPVKHYLVYRKEKGEKDFRLPVISRRTSFSLEELKSNTTYTLKATAVDEKNDESLPSNEITITTKNIRPGPPDKLTLSKGLSKDRKAGAGILRWSPAADPDGSIREYRVYRETGDGPVQIGKSTGTEFEVPAGVEPADLLVSAVDDNGDESEGLEYETWILGVKVSPVMYIPIGQMADLFKFGYGCTAGIFIDDLFFSNFIVGIDLGYAYWTGDPWLVERMHMVTLSAWIGYRIRVTSNLSVVPSVKGGAVGMLTRYRSCGESGIGVFETHDAKATEAMFGGALMLEYAITRSLFVQAGGDYTCIVETGEMPMFFGATIGAGMKL